MPQSTRLRHRSRRCTLCATMSLKIGSVGAGSFAQSFIPLFKAHPLVAEVTLCELEADKLAQNAAKHAICLLYTSPSPRD